MPYYDETTGLWYDDEGNVVPAPTETGPQPGAGTYGASGAPTTIDPAGDITWNIPAPGRTERLQGNIGDLGYQLAISGASLERAEQQLGERFDAGEYFRQINLYRNTIWAMEHGDRYLGGRQLPGALADVPAFTEELQRQPATAQGLQGALQDQPTPTDQQPQIQAQPDADLLPHDATNWGHTAEYNRRAPGLGIELVPENYDVVRRGYQQGAPEITDEAQAAAGWPVWEENPYIQQWGDFAIPPPGEQQAGLTPTGQAWPTVSDINSHVAAGLQYRNGRYSFAGRDLGPDIASTTERPWMEDMVLENVYGLTREQWKGGTGEDGEWGFDPQELQELVERREAGDPWLFSEFIPGMDSRLGEEVWLLGGMSEEDYGSLAAAGDVAGLPEGVDMEGFQALDDFTRYLQSLGVPEEELLGALEAAAPLYGFAEELEAGMEGRVTPETVEQTLGFADFLERQTEAEEYELPEGLISAPSTIGGVAYNIDIPEQGAYGPGGQINSKLVHALSTVSPLLTTMGVVGIDHSGSYNVREARTPGGEGLGYESVHAYGNAIDISSFYVRDAAGNVRELDLKNYNTMSPADQNTLTNLVNTFYQQGFLINHPLGSANHIHAEIPTSPDQTVSAFRTSWAATIPEPPVTAGEEEGLDIPEQGIVDAWWFDYEAAYPDEALILKRDYSETFRPSDFGATVSTRMADWAWVRVHQAGETGEVATVPESLDEMANIMAMAVLEREVFPDWWHQLTDDNKATLWEKIHELLVQQGGV